MIVERSARTFACTCVGLAILNGAVYSTSWAQEREGFRGAPSSLSVHSTQALSEWKREISEAVQSLREAVGEQAQTAARSQLQTAVRHYFDADMDGRRRQLAAIETRLTKLRAELDRRLAAKSEIIHLQLKALEKDDAGLGLYSRDEMSRLLANYFDADMKNRQGVLTDLASRAKKLHAELDRRHSGRDEIIQLQLNVLVAEAAGMGFYSPSNGNGS
jgi:hypothetical protein